MKTYTEFKAKYYSMLTEFIDCEPDTKECLALSVTLGELEDSYPEWTAKADEEMILMTEATAELTEYYIESLDA